MDANLETTRLGKTGLMVTRLGFGGVPLQRLTEEAAVTVLRGCLDLGVNFIDTANSYTTSEEYIGKAIESRQDGLVLATKSFARTPEMIKQHLELSLTRLGVESIDLFQFHGVNDYKSLEMVLAENGPIKVLREAKATGKIKHIGITSHSTLIAREAILSGQFETLQIPFNVINCEAADDLIPLARELDVGLIAMKPLAGGRLSDVRIAFRYLFQFPDVVPIPGIEKVQEMEELIGILQTHGTLTEAEEDVIERMRGELGTQFCRRCDYCQPCIKEIPISAAITISNPEKHMPPERLFNGWIDDVLVKASECTECGDCEERCPYHLPIREMIATEVKWYLTAKQNYLEGKS